MTPHPPERDRIPRRSFLTGALLAAPALGLGLAVARDGPGPGSELRALMQRAEHLTFRAQRLIAGRQTLAREFAPEDIRQGMRPNGTTDPADADYRAHLGTGFADWRLQVGGLVARPLALSLADLRAMPARTQITRHDCVEGWSCIAEWTGVPLWRVLEAAGPLPGARFVLFRCMDTMERGLSGPVRYHESLDMIEALHPQTILAWGMNGAPLPVANGAPLRLRAERQLGYKMAKYLAAIEVADRLPGRGSYWADRGYEWYAGI